MDVDEGEGEEHYEDCEDEEEEEEEEEEEGEESDGEEEEDGSDSEPDESEGEQDDEQDEEVDELEEKDEEELRTMVRELMKQIVSMKQSYKAQNKRADHTRLRGWIRGEKKGVRYYGPQTKRCSEEADRKHEERTAKWFVDELERSRLCRAGVINRLGLKLTVEERKQLRKKGFLSQEWFLAARSVVATLQEELYTAENTLEMRLSEQISVRAMRRIRKVLTQVKDASGAWIHKIVAEPPQHWSTKTGKGFDRSLKKECNREQGIYPNRPVFAPHVVTDDHASRAAGRRLLGGRRLEVAIPSRDGYSGAAWDLLDVFRDVWKAVDGRLRPLAKQPEPAQPEQPAAQRGLGRVRRLWIGFDGLTWTGRNGLVRWCVRSPDMHYRPNDPAFAREGCTYAGADKNAGLVAATTIGRTKDGDNSMRKRTDDAVVVTEIDAALLSESIRSDTSEKGLAMKAALSYACSIVFKSGPEGETQESLLVQGGDRAAGHAAFGLDSCIECEGTCMRCLARKPDWTKEHECTQAIRRNAVLSSILCHKDPRPRMKGFHHLPPFVCPCCLKDVTPELEASDAARLAQLSETDQKKDIRTLALSRSNPLSLLRTPPPLRLS